MPHHRLPAALLSLKVLMAASVIVPGMLFVYASWLNYVTLSRKSAENIDRALDVVQEQALKVFETIELTTDDANQILGDLSDDEIRAREQYLHDRLKEIADRLPQAGNILVIDKDGHPLVASSVYPVPHEISFADRTYFKKQAAGHIPPLISNILKPRLLSPDLFNISQRRPDKGGQFNGIVAVGVLPDYFRSFYQEMSGGIANMFGLMKTDGSVLVRYPDAADEPLQVGQQSNIMRSIAANPNAGTFFNASQGNRIKLQIGYRKIANYPVYALAGIDTSTIFTEWRGTLYDYLIFGLPATCLLLLINALALQQTRNAWAEAERRERAEAALKQSQRLEVLGQLTGGVAHDFSNLLMVVAGAGRMLRRPLSDERKEKIAEAIDQVVARGQSLTRQLLSFARRQALSPMALNLRDFLPRIRETLHTTLDAQIEVTLELGDAVWPVFADPGELELAILNLAVNARDAVQGRGKLAISAQNVVLHDDHRAPELEGDFVALTFADTGEGIAPEILPRIFEPFFTTKEVGKGTGMGLSQVYGFVKQSGGSVAVESIVGRGTAFTLYLPRSTGSPAELTVAPRQQQLDRTPPP